MLGKRKRRAPLETRRPPFDETIDLEVDRDAGEDVPTQRVIDLRVGVTVAERRVRHFTTDDRRILVEDVVRAKTEVVAIPDPRRKCEVEVALRRDLSIRRL